MLFPGISLSLPSLISASRQRTQILTEFSLIFFSSFFLICNFCCFILLSVSNVLSRFGITDERFVVLTHTRRLLATLEEGPCPDRAQREVVPTSCRVPSVQTVPASSSSSNDSAAISVAVTAHWTPWPVEPSVKAFSPYCATWAPRAAEAEAAAMATAVWCPVARRPKEIWTIPFTPNRSDARPVGWPSCSSPTFIRPGPP